MRTPFVVLFPSILNATKSLALMATVLVLFEQDDAAVVEVQVSAVTVPAVATVLPLVKVTM